MAEWIVEAETLEDLENGFYTIGNSGEPIVRCNDCKYVTEHYDTDGNVPYWTCSEWDSGTDYDGYCHYGERRKKMIEVKSLYNIGFEHGYAKAKVETETKHGRWISKSGSIYLYCSDCGREKIIDSDDWNYCPNCGAQMIDGGDNG